MSEEAARTLGVKIKDAAGLLAGAYLVIHGYTFWGTVLIVLAML